MKRLLSGNEAVARGAWEAGVRVASAYPGTPSTEILENFARYPNVYAEWAPNEKVAVDVAVGAAYAGRRAVAAARDACHKAGLLARVACLPEGLDPSRLLCRHGPEAVQGVVAAARGMLEYLVDSTLDSRLALDDLASQSARVRAVGRLLSSEGDPLVRAMAEQYVDQVVARLGVADARSFRQLAAAVQAAVARAEQGDSEEPGGAAPAALTSRTVHRSERLGQEVLGALLDCPQLLGDEELTQQLLGIEGDAAAAISAGGAPASSSETLRTRSSGLRVRKL